MSVGYRVKLLKLASGERLPLLLDRVGKPLFEPTVYALTELRARNQATNTISAALRAIQVFYLFLEKRGINLFTRLSTGKLLSLDEVEDLARMSRLPMEQLEIMLADSVSSGDQHAVLSLEKVRMQLRVGVSVEVDPAFAGTRLRYIRGYLEWLVVDLLARRTLERSMTESLTASLQYVVAAITARIPRGGSQKVTKQREGLEPEAVSDLLRVVSPLSPENPWRREYSRYRNELLVYWLYYLGLRRGELLGIRVQDVNFQKSTVTIHRRADDMADPRTNQPQSKTKAREIPLGEGLRLLTYAYVMEHRSALKGSRKHDFLFCADLTGKPMSLPTVNKIFRVLRANCPTLPDALSPHIMRHTWNDRFSEEMDKRQTPEESEKKLRSYLMGWSETSGTAATYTRRHIRVKAQEVLLKMQEQMTGEN